MATYAKTTVRGDGIARTRSITVEPAPHSDCGPLILITASDEASHSGPRLTRRSSRDPERDAQRIGRDLERDGYRPVRD
jgi:hypothetical protein